MAPSQGEPGAPSAGTTSYLVASCLMIVGSMLFTGSHGIVRYVSSDMHPLEMAFLSNLFSALFWIPWLIRAGIGALRTDQFWMHVIRAFCNVGSIITWYWSLSLTLLADATALATTMPLFSTLGAVLLLGEPMRGRRWAALIIGLAGAFIIIRPGFHEISVGYLLAMASCVLGAGSRVMAKYLRKRDHAVTCSAYLSLLQLPISFIFALTVWTPPTTVQWGWMAIVGVMVALAQLASVELMGGNDIGSLEPYNYLRLVWAAVIGYFAFAELPELWTWVGAAIIAGSTTYIMRREAKLARNMAGKAQQPRGSLTSLNNQSETIESA